MSLDPTILALLAGPIAISAAGRDSDLRPSVAHAYGCRVVAGGEAIRIFLLRDEARQVLADIAANGEVATVYSDVRSFRSLQIKGHDARIVAFDTEDAAYRAAYFRITSQELLALGHAPGLAQGYFSVPEMADFATVTFTPGEIFQQTPGPGAGAKLERDAKLAGSAA